MLRRKENWVITYILSENKDDKTEQQNERVIYLPDFNEKIRQLLLSQSVEDEKYSWKWIIKSHIQTTKELIKNLQLIQKLESDPIFIKHKIIEALRNWDYNTANELRNKLPEDFKPKVERTLAIFGFRGWLINN